jgi:hypothetical protein
MKKTCWGVFGVLLLGLASNARAVISSTATLNIDVTITGSKSVSVNNFNASTVTINWTGTPNAGLVPSSTATVNNNSGILTETWALSASSNSIDEGANNSPWANTGSTATVGNNQFAVQAVFGSSGTTTCPAGTAADWNSTYAPPLSVTLQTYSTTLFADSNLNTAPGTYLPDGGTNQLYAGAQRVLCWRIITPSSITNTDTQNIQIVVTAQ